MNVLFHHDSYSTVLTAIVSRLPVILGSGVTLFIASWALNVVAPHHKSDYTPLDAPAKKKVSTALKDARLGPGRAYLIPKNASHDDESSMMVYTNNTTSMGSRLVMSLAVNVAMAAKVAVAVSLASPTNKTNEALLAGFITVLSYSGASTVFSVIWYSHPIRMEINNTIDSLVYGGLTALCFYYM